MTHDQRINLIQLSELFELHKSGALTKEEYENLKKRKTAMQHKKLKLSTVLLFVIGMTGLQAQNTIPATGGNATGAGGASSYTVGQIVYTTESNSNGSVAKGVQQPYEISVVSGIEEALGISIEILVYPNPTTEFITLKIENHEVLNLRYQLYDMNGRLIRDNKVDGDETSIVMSSLLPATYFLKVTDNKKVEKTFKIIKN